MFFLALGVVLLVLKYLAIGPFEAMSWWVALFPFACAVAWWTWADKSGHTKRKAMERENKRRDARRERTKEALGSINRSSRHR